MINLQWNHEQIINFSKNATRCTCPEPYWRAAIIYSLVASCKLNEIDPFRYFRDVLTRVSTHPADKIDELLPSEWKKLNATADADLSDDTAKTIKVA